MWEVWEVLSQGVIDGSLTVTFGLRSRSVCVVVVRGESAVEGSTSPGVRAPKPPIMSHQGGLCHQQTLIDSSLALNTSLN